MLNQFSRTQLLFGKEAMEKLSGSRVAVFGIGGVGGMSDKSQQTDHCDQKYNWQIQGRRYERTYSGHQPEGRGECS